MAKTAWQDIRSWIAGWVPMRWRMGVRAVIHRGTSEVCSMCGARIKGLVQNGLDVPVLSERRVIGGLAREADRCPVCQANDRTRLMRFYLERESAVARPGGAPERVDAQGGPVRILHIAPDLGLMLWLGRQPGIAYTGSDLSRHRYRHVPNFVAADLTALPFEDASFDIVICSHVLEHVPDDAQAMAELYRVACPGGRVLALVPMATDDRPTDEDLTLEDPAEKERRFGQWDHVRLYHRDDFLARLGRAGFRVDLYDAYAVDAAAAAAAHLNPLELLPVCHRARAVDLAKGVAAE